MPNALDVDKEGDVGDWRMDMIGRIDGDQGAYKDNQIIRHVVAVEVQPGIINSFAVPSSVALALDISEQAAQNAASLRIRIPFQEIKTSGAAAFGVTTDGLAIVYDFLEQSMIAAVFAYQSIESFANGVIGRHLTAPMKVPRGGRRLKELTPEQIARRFSTSEKLRWVLPKIKGVEPPDDTASWKRFERLELARDSIVHLKVKDQYAKDRDSLFFKMLTISPTEFPSSAASIIRHYFKQDCEPRWLLKFLRARDHS